jgi:hypothetical protein
MTVVRDDVEPAVLAVAEPVPAQVLEDTLSTTEETEACWFTYESLPKSSMYFDAAQDKWFKNEACARQFAARQAAQPRSSQEVSLWRKWNCFAGCCSVCDSPNLGGQVY